MSIIPSDNKIAAFVIYPLDDDIFLGATPEIAITSENEISLSDADEISAILTKENTILPRDTVRNPHINADSEEA